MLSLLSLLSLVSWLSHPHNPSFLSCISLGSEGRKPAPLFRIFSGWSRRAGEPLEALIVTKRFRRSWLITFQPFVTCFLVNKSKKGAERTLKLYECEWQKLHKWTKEGRSIILFYQNMPHNILEITLGFMSYLASLFANTAEGLWEYLLLFINKSVPELSVRQLCFRLFSFHPRRYRH